MKVFKNVKHMVAIQAVILMELISNFAFAASGGLNNWTLGKKLNELGEFFISDILAPIGVIVVIAAGIMLARGNSGQGVATAIKAIAGLTLAAAASGIAYWIIGK